MSDTQERKSPALWLQEIDRCKLLRQELVRDWTDNVSFLRGKPFEEDSDEHRIAVNLDWSKTKAKHANLFSQVPQVVLTAKQPRVAPAVAPFTKAINDELSRAKVGTAVDDAVIDCINAAGIGVVVVNYERLTDEVEVPLIDVSALPPDLAMQALQSGQIPTQTVKRTTDQHFTIRRISPADLLWPVDFSGSDFNDADWIGRTGLLSWAEAKNQFGLTDDVKDRVVGGERRTPDQTLRDNVNRLSDTVPAGRVEFDEIYYWNHRVDPDEKYFKAIRRLVFVTGLTEPVIDEPWNGQEFHPETRSYIGSCKFPIQVLTLARIPDDCIPPSDSAIGRPQILELIKSRSQMITQRERSLPIRWFDVNRVDPLIQESLMQGTWQGMIPTQGDGGRIIGEIARASYPREDMDFDRIAKADIDEVWQSGANQAGSFASGERSAAEAKIVQGNFQTRVGYERARVAEFFLNITEVLAGLMALYSDFPTLSDEEKQMLQQAWDRKTVSQEVLYTVRVDSTVLLDANQRIERLMGVLNMVGKSGVIDPAPLIKEIVTVAGLVPTPPPPPPPPQPEQPNISFRFSGEDLANPLVIGILQKAGLMPNLPAPQQQPEGAPQMVPNPDYNAMPKITKRSVDYDH